jgi:integrase
VHKNNDFCSQFCALDLITRPYYNLFKEAGMPVAKITKTFVDRVPYTPKGQIAYCDSDLSGFYLIVGMRSKTYVAQKDIQGRSTRYTIGRHGHFTPEEARKIAKDKLYIMAQGVNPNAEDEEERAKAITVEAALESYITTRRNLRLQTAKDYRYYVDLYLKDWKLRLMVEITKEMVAARHLKIGEEHGPVCANKAMRVLRALFNHCQATFDICPVNPVSYLTHAKAWFKEKRRRTYIKPSDLKAWWDAVHKLENDTYRDFLLVLLFTGMRRSEAARMRWVDVDFNDKTFLIPDTKNGDPLTLPLSDYLFQLLQRRHQRYGGGEFVFPGPGKAGHLAEPKKGIALAAASSGISFTCHDLRRTFITIAESMDISAYALKRLLNHRVTDVTGGYIIVDAERLRDPVQRIAQFITAQLGA